MDETKITVSGEIAAALRWFALIVTVCCLALVSGCYLMYYAPAREGMCQGSTAGVSGWVWVRCPAPPPAVPASDDAVAKGA